MTQDGGYDIIGDVHGCADQLEQLLRRMGYQHGSDGWRHESRRAVFVGDFIDRGPRQLEAVAIPRTMVEAGNAHAVLGNHEFNAVSMATKDENGDWNRAHSDRNLKQTRDFRDAVEDGSSRHHDIIDWFQTLPLWLDLDGIRVVHACWHKRSMETLEPWLSEAGGLTPELVVEANKKGTAAYDAIEVVLKGPEAELNGYSYTDKDDHSRYNGRVKWWDPAAATLQAGIRLDPTWNILDANGAAVEELPDDPLPEWLAGITPTDPDRSPVFFGHYWFNTDLDGLNVINPKAACVDFSAVRQGPLVAYRWSGESELISKNLITSNQA